MSHYEEVAPNVEIGNSRGPEGIGGWLILVILGMGVSLLNFGSVINSVMEAFSEGYVAAIEAYNGKGFAYTMVLYYEIFIAVALAAVVIWAFYLLFTKNHNYPVVMSSMYIASLVLVTIDAIAIYYVAGDIVPTSDIITPIITGTISALIWVNYFRVSVRVRNTFGRNGLFSI